MFPCSVAIMLNRRQCTSHYDSILLYFTMTHSESYFVISLMTHPESYYVLFIRSLQEPVLQLDLG
jgi:hypothetical protein